MGTQVGQMTKFASWLTDFATGFGVSDPEKTIAEVPGIVFATGVALQSRLVGAGAGHPKRRC